MAITFNDIPKEFNFKNRFEIIVFDPTLPVENNAKAVSLSLLTSSELINATESFSFNIPEKRRLVNIAILNSCGQSVFVKFGTTNGGTEISEDQKEIIDTQSWDFNYGKTFWQQTSIFITVTFESEEPLTGDLKLLIDIK